MDRGRHWIFPPRHFPSRAGNLNWVMEGKDQPNRDGYLYAIANEREFNASNIYLGRVRPTRRQVPNPDAWQWRNPINDTQGGWRHDLNLAHPVLTWPNHITYPRMTFDPGLGRYLLSFSYSYANESNPATFTGGAELAVLESPAPWGPYRFVFREPYWGPSNGYGGSFPIKWQSADGRTLWMYWAANWDITHGGCLAGLDCRGRYGYNLRQLQLTMANRRRSVQRRRPASPRRRSGAQPPLGAATAKLGCMGSIAPIGAQAVSCLGVDLHRRAMDGSTATPATVPC